MALLNAPNATLAHREAYLDIATVSDCDGAPGRWPDALVPTRDPWLGERRNALPATVVGGNLAFWLDVFVPPAVEAGNYSATLTATLTLAPGPGQGGQGKALELTAAVSLRVFGFALPSTSPHYKSAYGLSPVGVLMAAFGREWRLHEAHAVNLSRRYVELGLMHRLSFTHGGLPLPLPWPNNPTAQAGAARLGASPPPPPPPPPRVEWGRAFLRAWGAMLSPRGVDLPFGLRGASLTSSEAGAQQFNFWGLFRGPPKATHRQSESNIRVREYSAGGVLVGTPPRITLFVRHTICFLLTKTAKVFSGGKSPLPDPKLAGAPCRLEVPAQPPELARELHELARQGGWGAKLMTKVCDEPASPSTWASCASACAAARNATPWARCEVSQPPGPAPSQETSWAGPDRRLR